MLQGIDTLVLDLQDIGSRFYTYTTTMGYVMEEAAKRKIAIVVLDRPNPVNGTSLEGPTVDQSELSFTAYHPMPIRHGLTLGELAMLFNAEKKIGADLTVVVDEMLGPRQLVRPDRADVDQPVAERAERWWRRETSPQASAPSGVKPLGRARHRLALRAVRRARGLTARGWRPSSTAEPPGVRFYRSLHPASSRFANELCHGVFIIVTDRDRMRPVRVGVEVASALYRLFPAAFEVDKIGRLFGADAVRRILVGEDPAAIAAAWSRAESGWRLLRSKYLKYR
jgi:uncharacterized protein YbbC (DUF1343 family)